MGAVALMTSLSCAKLKPENIESAAEKKKNGPQTLQKLVRKVDRNRTDNVTNQKRV